MLGVAAKFMRLFKKIAAALLLHLVVAVSTQAAPRPNFLFIFIDDLGWGDLSCYGSTVTNKQGQVITPNLDQLAAQGMRFTQGYVAAPICSPSRTGVLTGMEPCRFAIYSFLDSKTQNAARNMVDWVPPDTVTAPRLFQRAGYRTGQFGKWHMGNGRDVNNAPPPSSYGFEESLVAFEGNGNRLLYYNDNGTKYSLSQQNEDASVGTYQYCYFYQAASNHTTAALAFITNAVNAGKPFYVHVPYNDTHSPYNVAPGQENDFDHITSDVDSKTFLTELHNLDRQIGRLVAAVDALGIGSNTVIVVVGDNGAPNDSLNTILKRNGGLRGGKGNLYEGGFRETFLVRCPGLVAAGVVNSNTAISTLDLLPTYCSLAGIALPNAPFAGEDMSDVWRGASRQRHGPLFWEYGTVAGLSPASPQLAIRNGNYKFMRDPDGSQRELYLIPQDHAEATNLVNQPGYSGVVSNLEAQLVTWYDQVVLGNVGPTYACGSNSFIGGVIADTYDVSGGNSPGTGFGTNSGVNYQLTAGRLTGAAAASLFGYRLGTTGGRTASDFSIAGNRLTAAPRNGNCRFEFSADSITACNFGSYLAGRTYELSVQMTIDLVGTSYAQRMSLSVSDASDAPVNNVDFGIQIGTDSAGALGVFKRIDAASASGGADVNTKVAGGLAIGAPINLKIRIVDYNATTADFNSTYEIFVNGASVNTGSFRFENSTTARYLIFDVAAHEGQTHYDNLQLTVTADNGGSTVCRKPILSLAELDAHQSPSKARLFWTVQPGVSVQPEWSSDLNAWLALSNGLSGPLRITTPHGSLQWLEVTSPPAITPNTFFRLRLE